MFNLFTQDFGVVIVVSANFALFHHYLGNNYTRVIFFLGGGEAPAEAGEATAGEGEAVTARG